MTLSASTNCFYARGVETRALFNELIGACRMLGLVVREGPMKVPATRLAGGLVRLRGTPIVLLDSNAPLIDRVAAVADAICELEVDVIHLSPDARRAVSHARVRRKRARKRLRVVRADSTSAWKTSRLLRIQPGAHHLRDDEEPT